MAAPLLLDGSPLTTAEVAAVARGGHAVELAPATRSTLASRREALLRRASGGEALYGITTGFGSFSRIRIPDADLARLQVHLVRSHAAGVGEPLPDEVVRATMLLTAASLARGHSGARPAVVEALLSLLRAGITPIVPSRGSVGASGDLAPLAHIARVLIGEGEARVGNATVPAAQALAAAGLAPVALEAKEGLSLCNGTHLMAAIGALAMEDARHLEDAAITAAAMAIDAARGSSAPLDERIHAVRRQPGQARVATAMRRLLHGSHIGPSHLHDDPRVQDPYCLRAAPQVIGAASDLIAFARTSIQAELGAVTDNPLLFDAPAGVDIVPGANFHGMPMALALDSLKLALCHIAGIAERRIYWVLSGHDREAHLSPNLAGNPGLMSGLMIVQYTAAACCNELQVLAHPASVGNIPTSAGIEDYNSMGATSALHARHALDLATQVVAIELLCMSEALDRHRPLKSGAGIEAAHTAVRAVVQPLHEDRSPAQDIAAIAARIRAGAFALGGHRAHP